jgi:pyruvate ferredoxin oxidoreductase alpha subunit
MPVMVCMDGFILTHAYERVDMPTQAEVDAFLPPYEPRQVLDPAEPVSIGAMVGPEAFMEVRYLAHAKQTMALERIPQIAAEFAALRPHHGGLVRPTAARTPRPSSWRWARCSARSRTRWTRCATTASKHRRAGHPLVPPLPAGAVREALQGASAWWCWRRASRSAWAAWCPTTCAGAVGPAPARLHGGRRAGRPRDHQGRCTACCARRSADTLEPLTFLDLDWRIVERQLNANAACAAAARSPRTCCATWARRGQQGELT